MLKMLYFILSEAPQKISAIFWPFLAIFTQFHLKNWPYLQKPEFGNLAKIRFWLLLVNKSLCSIPLSCTRSEIKETPGDRCEGYDDKRPTFSNCSSDCRNWYIWGVRVFTVAGSSKLLMDSSFSQTKGLLELSGPPCRSAEVHISDMFWYLTMSIDNSMK